MTPQPEGLCTKCGTEPCEEHAVTLKPLDVVDDRRPYCYQPVLDRRPSEQTIRERAEFLAHEIFDDRLAPEEEIADAIEREIKRFAHP